MNDSNDRYDPNSMDNYLDDLYYEEHYGSSGGGFGRRDYSPSGLYVLLALLSIPLFLIGIVLLVAVPPLGALILLAAKGMIDR